MNEIVFTGYLAEMIILQAEKRGMTPEDYIVSFFTEGALHQPAKESFAPEVHCT